MKGFSGIIELKNVNIEYSFQSYNSKFVNDKITYEDSEFIVLLDGIILNSTTLCEKYNCGNVKSLIMLLWKEKGALLVRELKGSYNLVVFDKDKKEFLITNDWLSKRPMYYFKNADKIYFSTRFFDLVELLKENKVELKYNLLAFALMMKEGFVSDNLTYIEELLYLQRYESIVGDETGCNIKTTEPKSIIVTNLQDALVEFNKLFSNAVELQCRKNEENGYAQVATLSAGMDSRSVVLSAIKLGYKEIHIFTYAESGSVDYQVACQIAKDNDLDMLFYQLDNANFVLNPDGSAYRNECQQCYCGATGAYPTSRLLNLDNVGIIHTGSLGGELMSDIYRAPKSTPAKNIFQSDDKGLFLEYENIIKKYKDSAKINLQKHNRCCQNFFRMFEDKCECCSPFMDEDVYEFVCSLDPSWLYKRAFYVKWMRSFLPNKYVTTYFKAGISLPKFFVIVNKIYFRIIKIVKGKNKFDMNPVSFWFKNSIFNSKYEKTENQLIVNMCKSDRDFINKIEGFVTGESYNKLYYLTCLEALKYMKINE